VCHTSMKPAQQRCAMHANHMYLWRQPNLASLQQADVQWRQWCYGQSSAAAVTVSNLDKVFLIHLHSAYPQPTKKGDAQDKRKKLFNFYFDFWDFSSLCSVPDSVFVSPPPKFSQAIIPKPWRWKQTFNNMKEGYKNGIGLGSSSSSSSSSSICTWRILKVPSLLNLRTGRCNPFTASTPGTHEKAWHSKPNVIAKIPKHKPAEIWAWLWWSLNPPMDQISTTRAAGEGEERIPPKTKEKKFLLQSKSSRSPTTKLINKSAIIKH